MASAHSYCESVTMASAWMRRSFARADVPAIGDYRVCASEPEAFGADLDVWSEHGAGTEVELSVPAEWLTTDDHHRHGSEFTHSENGHELQRPDSYPGRRRSSTVA